MYMSKTDAALGFKIKRLRESFGEGQTAFGARFGVEQATVSRWENGYIPKRTLWGKIASVAGASQSDFFFGVEAEEDQPGLTRVPVVSRMAAGKFSEAAHPLTDEDIELYIHENLPPGDWISFIVDGDSMNQIAPDGSLILVNRRMRELVNGSFYAVALPDGTASFKRFREPPVRLEPYSTNAIHETMFFDEPTQIDVIGRVERVVNNLV